MFSRNATKSIILFCLIIFTFGLIGCSNLFNVTPFGNVIFSFKLPSHLQTSRGGETSYTLRVSLHEKNDAIFQSDEKIIGGGGEETLISFPAVPIDKEIYVKASLFKNNSLVYSGKTEVIKVVKGDNRVKLALDKSYMVTFSWEGKTKQIEVKSENLIPVSEIPEIYTPDGKAVVWYNGNNAFSFSNGINEKLSLSSKVVDITAETVCDVIKTRYGDMEQLVKLQGNCSSELVIKMGAALKENPNAKIILDLGDVTGLTEIPQEAFVSNNNLVEITLPECVTEIGWGAFIQCRSLKKVHSLGSISVIQSTTFNRCDSLTSLRIPASVTTLEYAISYCPKLTDIIIDEGNTNFIAENGVIYSRDKTTIVTYPSANGELIIDNSVTKIGKAAFNGCKITSLTISGNIQEIDDNAFSSCEFLETVDIQANIETIPYWCFGTCRNLKSITIPSSVEHIETAAFAYCQKLTDIRIAGNNFIVENGAIYIDDGTTLLAFPSASGNVTISETVTSIADEAFRGCLAESVTIPSSVTSIGRYNFNNCHNLETVEIFAKVSVLPQSLFSYSQNLTSVTIPATVTSIEWGAFDGCENLRYVTYTGTQEMWNAISKQDGNSYLYNAELTCTGEFTEVPEIPTETVEVAASEAANTIYNLSGRNLVIVTGECSSETVSYIGNALRENYDAQILLDLSDVSGLTSIPQECFRNSNSLVEVTLPETVTEIGSQAFSWCSSLQSVNNLGNISTIPNSCFSGCENLTTITIPSTVETIESWSFQFCGLKQILIPASVTDVRFSAFQNCYNLIDIQVSSENTTYSAEGGILYNYDKTVLHSWPSANGDITIPSNVTTIGRAAFRGCNLERLVIPEGVTTIETEAIKNCENIVSLEIPASVTLIEGDFYACPNLQIIVADENENYSSENGVLYNKVKTELIAYPSASGNLYLLENITTIGERAFGYCPNLESVVIPESVIDLGQSAFNDCRNLQTVEIRGNISIIKSGTFCNCKSLQNITIPATVTSIEGWVFDGCSSLSTVTYTGTEQMWNAIDIIEEGNSSLYNAELTCTGEFTEVPEIPVTEISVEASEAADTIYNLSGRNLVIVTGECSSETVSYIGNALRENYNAQILLDLSDVSGLNEIPQGCFRESNSLVEITLPESVTKIGMQAFCLCRSLQSVYNLGNISTIPDECFSNSENLTSVTIPASVEIIETRAFAGCPKLTNIVIEDGNGTFTVNNRAIYTDRGTKLVAYPSASGDITIDSSINTIGATAFYGSRITSVIIPANVTNIGWEAFGRCEYLETVDIQANIETIPEWCFDWCVNLQSITIPASVERIESCAFIFCQKLTDISISENNFIENDGAIYTADGTTLVAYPSASESVVIPDDVTTIGAGAFAGSLVDSITIPESVTNIGWEAFSRCDHLETVEILAKVSVIPQSMFAWSQKLTSVTIPATVTSIERGAFEGCEALTTINYAGTEALWINISKGDNNECLSKATIIYGDITEVPEIPTETVEVTASEAADRISELTGRYRVIVDGVCSSENISAIGYAVCSNSSARILLDLSGTEGLNSIQSETFFGNTSLVELTLPESVTEICEFAIYGCESLKTIHSLGRVSVIQDYNFFECTNLESVTIPATLETMGLAFIQCPKLTNIVIEEENENFVEEKGAIYSKDMKTLLTYPSASGNIEIPETVTTINMYAFADCENLTEITFKDTDGWYATDPNSGEQKQFELTDPSTNAELLVGDYCYYYWTKVEE